MPGFQASARRPPGRGLRLRLHPESAHPLTERVAVHAEELRGAELISIRAREGGRDERLLHRRERRLVAPALRLGGVEDRLDEPADPALLRAGRGQQADEVLRGHAGARELEERALHDVLQLADVARPWVGEEQRLRVLREEQRAALQLLAVLREEVRSEEHTS